MSTELVAIEKIEIRHGDKNADEIRMEKEFLEDKLTKKKAAKHPRFFEEVVEVEEEKPQA